MKIDWRTISHSSQRYPTVGDWWWDGEDLNIRVSKMSDRRYEWLVGIHELIEVFLCRFADIDSTAVDKFDEAYEETRSEGQAPCGCQHHDEPGDDPHAPYGRQHSIASFCERALAVFLGVSWGEYDREVESL